MVCLGLTLFTGFTILALWATEENKKINYREA